MPRELAVIAARRLPRRQRLGGSSVVGLHSACVVGVLARLQAIDERVSERGRGLGGALCSRGRLVYEQQQRARGAGMEAWRQWPVPESDVGFRAGRPTNLPCTSPNGATALVARLRLLERRPSRYALWKIIAPVSQCYYYILGVRWGAFSKRSILSPIRPSLPSSGSAFV